MNVKEIQLAFYHANHARYEIVAPNVFVDPDTEMDICGIRPSGYIDEIEIKLSKADFYKDFKKTLLVKVPLEQGKHKWARHNKHLVIREGEYRANRFSFLMPAELADELKDTIPAHIGLYIARHDRVFEIKSARLMHKRKIVDSMKYQIARKFVFRYWQKQ